MLVNSINLYNKLDQVVNNIENAEEKDYIKAIVVEYVIIKCANEIKSVFQNLIYAYLSNNEQDDLAKKIIYADKHVMPRDCKKLDEVFKDCSFDITGIDQIKVIVAERNTSAHNSSTNVKISWEFLKQAIDDSSMFLTNFKDYINSKSS